MPPDPDLKDCEARPRAETVQVNGCLTDLTRLERGAQQEVQPRRLSLVHGEENPPAVEPGFGGVRRIVVDLPKRDFPEPGRVEIAPTIARISQHALEVDG